MFQFYLSSIKSVGRLRIISDVQCFNSTLVQLKGWSVRPLTRPKNCFNSTLVQLKVPNCLCLFRTSHCFNSTLVQLKVGVR